MSDQRLSEAKSDAELPELSQRQTEILHLLMRGAPNKEIATELGIGLGTVKQHMVALFKKLNVTSRAMAISKGYAIDGKNQPVSAAAPAEVEGQMEMRPAAVLSLSVGTHEVAAAAAVDAWTHLRRAAADATSELDATMIVRTGSGIDIIVGLHHAYEDNAIKAARVARDVARVVHDELPHAILRGGLSSGYLMGSMQRRGGWTGETVAGRLIGAARDLSREAAPDCVLLDAATRRMMAFAHRREAEEQGDGAAVWRLDEADLPTVRGKPVLPAIVGRASERNQLMEIRRHLQRGKGGLVWLEGEAGMGKTTLARAFGEECQTLGFGWFEADCKDPELGLAPALARLAGLRGATPADPASFREAVEAGLDRQLAPLVIFIDDLHLADELTIRLIELLAPITEHRPLLLLGTSRAVRHPRLAALPNATSLRLGHLGDREMESLIKARCGGSVTTQLLAGIRNLAGGVPLFAVELAREARLRAAASRNGALEIPPAPLSLVTLVLSRLDTLALDRVLLRNAALRGPVSRADLRGDWAGSKTGFDKALDDAVQSGVLTVEPDSRDRRSEIVAFRHPLLVQVLRQVMLAAELAQFQRMLGAQIAVANR